MADVRQVMKDVGPLVEEEMRELLGHIGPYCVQDDAPASKMPRLGAMLKMRGTGEGSNVVNRVLPGSVAASVGIRGGDIIVGVDEAMIADGEALINALNKHDFGDTVRVTVLREGARITYNARLRQDSFTWTDVGIQWNRRLCVVASELGGKTSFDIGEVYRQEKTRHFATVEKYATSTEKWNERWKGVQLCTMPTLLCSIDDSNRQFRIGDLTLSLQQFRVLLQSVGGRGVVIEFEAEADDREIPDWVTEEVLVPSGYINCKSQDLV